MGPLNLSTCEAGGFVRNTMMDVNCASEVCNIDDMGTTGFLVRVKGDLITGAVIF